MTTTIATTQAGLKVLLLKDATGNSSVFWLLLSTNFYRRLSQLGKTFRIALRKSDALITGFFASINMTPIATVDRVSAMLLVELHLCIHFGQQIFS